VKGFNNSSKLIIYRASSAHNINLKRGGIKEKSDELWSVIFSDACEEGIEHLIQDAVKHSQMVGNNHKTQSWDGTKIKLVVNK